MNQLQAYTDRLTEWLERLLLKGLHKIDTKDLEELESLQGTAQHLEMSFLTQLLEELTVAGKSYQRTAHTEIDPLIARYLSVAQYVQMMKASA